MAFNKSRMMIGATIAGFAGSGVSAIENYNDPNRHWYDMESRNQGLRGLAMMGIGAGLGDIQGTRLAVNKGYGFIKSTLKGRL